MTPSFPARLSARGRRVSAAPASFPSPLPASPRYQRGAIHPNNERNLCRGVYPRPSEREKIQLVSSPPSLSASLSDPLPASLPVLFNPILSPLPATPLSPPRFLPSYSLNSSCTCMPDSSHLFPPQPPPPPLHSSLSSKSPPQNYSSPKLFLPILVFFFHPTPPQLPRFPSIPCSLHHPLHKLFISPTLPLSLFFSTPLLQTLFM